MGITGRHADDEVRKLDDLAVGKDGDDLATALLRGVVKGVAIVVKLLVGIRGNQVRIMEKMGIELRAPRGRDRKDTKNEARD